MTLKYLAFFLAFFSFEQIKASNVIDAKDLLFPSLVDRLYDSNPNHLFWVNTDGSTNTQAAALLDLIDSAMYIGLDKSKYHYSTLQEISKKSPKNIDSIKLIKLDRVYTDAAIAFAKDIYQGRDFQNYVRYDEWSEKYKERDDHFIVSRLLVIKSAQNLTDFITSLEPSSTEYNLYKVELRKQLSFNNLSKAKQVSIALNYYRWIHHFAFDKLILVNIPSATLRYYENNEEVLFSKVIVGKPSTKSPRFAAQCKQIILYPYWNVPASILYKELLPKYKKSPGLIDAENMQVVDKNGHVVNHSKLNWSQFNRGNFPYRLRQSTGCDNSLGVLKLDLTDPFGVYLHDTNTKRLFASNNRYRSHGCIRIEKALELGNYLLQNKLDTTFLNKCLKDEEPKTVKLNYPVPVFVIYNTVQVDTTGVVVYYKDIYHLF